MVHQNRSIILLFEYIDSPLFSNRVKLEMQKLRN